VLLSDTVGFIQKLPTHLVAAFRATLEELEDADVLIHMVDITHPEAAEQFETVQATLKDLGVESKPQVVAFNKVDMLAEGNGVLPADLRAIDNDLGREHPDAVLISAARKWNLDGLLRAVELQLVEAGEPHTYQPV
jgi:GTP-binding protein HflX